MIRKSSYFILIVIFSLCIVIIFDILYATNNPVLEACNKFNEDEFNYKMKIENLRNRFGEYETLAHTHGENYIFYWPSEGFIAICHPHYQAQHRKKQIEEYRVTSYIFPLEKKIRVDDLPVKGIFEFERLCIDKYADIFGDIKIYVETNYRLVDRNEKGRVFRRGFNPFVYDRVRIDDDATYIWLERINIFDWYD